MLAVGRKVYPCIFNNSTTHFYMFIFPFLLIVLFLILNNLVEHERERGNYAKKKIEKNSPADIR